MNPTLLIIIIVILVLAIFVLWRAMQTAAPAGAIADCLNFFGLLLGLDGVILLA
ncbi:MAG TPA: hypothetical protein VMN99_05675 [Anaerolineales bacterium]|nr:hypothetical protein [Anaerolineales bacterium]